MKCTNIISKEEMLTYLTNCNVENPTEILTKAIKRKTSTYIPELKAVLAWIYVGETPWNHRGDNSNNLNDYNFQIMPCNNK